MSPRPPSRTEKEIVADIYCTSWNVIGSVDDIWSIELARRLLPTVRATILGICDLFRAGRAIGPSRVRATVKALFPLEELPALDETVKHLLEDNRARAYWDDLMPDKSYPHVCPSCGLGAYIGFKEIQCKYGCF